MLSTPGLVPEKSWELLIARASIRKQQGKDGPMQADCVKALESVISEQEAQTTLEALTADARVERYYYVWASGKK